MTHTVFVLMRDMNKTMPSGGSRNFERGVQQVGWREAAISPREGRKIFFTCSFSDQE